MMLAGALAGCAAAAAATAAAAPALTLRAGDGLPGGKTMPRAAVSLSGLLPFINYRLGL